MAKKGRRATEEERELAIRLIESGRKIDEVVEIMGVGRQTVFDWWRKYREGGRAALVTKAAPGRPSRLNGRQTRELRALILACEPRHFGMGYALWTRALVQELIRRRFGVSLSQVSVGRLLTRLGLSAQRPLHQARQQDAEAVRVWKEQTYPAIRAQAAQVGGIVLFADEAGVRTDFHSGTTWGQVGATPVVQASGQRQSVMMVSAVSALGHLRFHLHEGTFRAHDFIGFCRGLLADAGTDVFLIVDNSSVHTANEVKEFVGSTAGRLQVFFLPPYSPELNPDEWVWKNVKNDQVGRSAVHSRDGLRCVAHRALARLQKMPHIVRAFFNDPHLSYIRGLPPDHA